MLHKQNDRFKSQKGIQAFIIANAGGISAMPQSAKTGSGYLSLSGCVRANGINWSLSGAIITVVAGRKIVAIACSDKKGNFSFKALAQGIYTLTFTRTGYADKLITNVIVAQGIAARLDAMLFAV